jgi:hypothetical protein
MDAFTAVYLVETKWIIQNTFLSFFFRPFIAQQLMDDPPNIVIVAQPHT